MLNNQKEVEAETEGGLSGTSIFFLLVAAALLIIGVLVIVRKKKGRNGGTKMLIGLLIITAAMSTAGSVYAFGWKGDVNSDGCLLYTSRCV